MIAIKDIESLKNMAAMLFLPLLAAAFLVDDPLNFQHDPTIEPGLNSSLLLIKIGSWALCALMVVVFVTFAVALLDSCIVWVHVHAGDSFVMPWVGFAFITCGLLIFFLAFPNMPKLFLNPFWHLGFLTYGITLIDRAAK